VFVGGPGVFRCLVVKSHLVSTNMRRTPAARILVTHNFNQVVLVANSSGTAVTSYILQYLLLAKGHRNSRRLNHVLSVGRIQLPSLNPQTRQQIATVFRKPRSRYRADVGKALLLERVYGVWGIEPRNCLEDEGEDEADVGDFQKVHDNRFCRGCFQRVCRDFSITDRTLSSKLEA